VSDRTIHGRSQSGGEIVRYERAGKWYIEYGNPPHRLPITVGDAALFATVKGAEAYLGRPGGSQFDAKVRVARG